jgi:predicted nucleic acid-binding protein
VDRIILDTDVSSLSYKGRLPPSLLARLSRAKFGITFVTLGELTQWATLRDWGPRNRDRLTTWLSTKAVLPYNADVARTWGRISSYAIRRGRPRPANDTWIAACCLVYELPLATLNVKDFADFAEHEGLTLITA